MGVFSAIAKAVSALGKNDPEELDDKKLESYQQENEDNIRAFSSSNAVVKALEKNLQEKAKQNRKSITEKMIEKNNKENSKAKSEEKEEEREI